MCRLLMDGHLLLALHTAGHVLGHVPKLDSTLKQEEAALASLRNLDMPLTLPARRPCDAIEQRLPTAGYC